MNAQKHSLSTKNDILDAANRVVNDHGANTLTLEAAAREAGVSKGGLLYHFPSKDALVTGMIDHLLVGFDAALEHELAANNDLTPGAWLRAYIRTTFAPEPQLSEATAALIAAIATNPSLLQPVRERFAEWQQRAEHDGIEPAKANAVRLAVDGLWFAELLGLAPLDDQRRAELMNSLLELATEAKQ